MIDIANNAKSTSRNCDKALDMEYIEMMIYRNKIEEEIRKLMNLMPADAQPVHNADVFIQFPHHESLLVDIKVCPTIVRGMCLFEFITFS